MPRHGMVIASCLLGGAALLAGWGSPGPVTRPPTHPSHAETRSLATYRRAGLPTAVRDRAVRLLAASTAAAGTTTWRLRGPWDLNGIEGFADHASVLPGGSFRLYVSTASPRFSVTAYRMGWYDGAHASQVWSVRHVRGDRQAPAQVGGPTHLVVAPWSPSLTVPTMGWQPGDYLLRLHASLGPESYVPLTVRSPSTAGAVVLVNAVATWAAYDHWGGYSLYSGDRTGSLPAARTR